MRIAGVLQFLFQQKHCVAFQISDTGQVNDELFFSKQL